jgi:uncharacterized protein
MNSADEQIEKVDGSAVVSVSADELEAWLTLSSPKGGGEPVQIGQVLKALSAAGVREGIDRPALEAALERGLWGRQILAAKGTPGEPSQDGRIDYHFPLPDEKLKPVETEDGRVDFRNLNLIHNVKRGDVLAVRTPAVPGKAGLTVTGHALLPKPVRDSKLVGGQNTLVDPTGCHLLATANGHVNLTDGKVVVLAIFVVEHDVDFSIGNVDFVGNVLVNGDVKSGFVVKAGGDIEIRGLIESAQVTAGGNLLVKNGILGTGHCQIRAKGNIVARYVEGADLEAGGNVIVQDSIIRSQVKANGAIKVEGRQGEIIGGHLQALDEITARVIGSDFSIPTILELGIAPTLRKDYNLAVGQLHEKQRALTSLEGFIREYQSHVEKGREVSEAWKRAIAQRLVEYEKVRSEVETLTATVETFEAELVRVQQGQVKAYANVYPGVTITLGRSTLTVQDLISRSMFKLEDGQIKTHPIRY